MDMAFGRGVSPRRLGGETDPPFLREREGQGAGFPEIWGVPPLLKPPSPATPPLSWNPVPRGGVGEERSFRECREEGRAGSPEAWVPAGGLNGRGSGLRSVRREEDGSVRSSDGPGCRVEQGVGDRRSLQKRCGRSWTQGQRGACCRCHDCSHRQGAGEQAAGQGLGELLGESQRALQPGERREKRGHPAVLQTPPFLAPARVPLFNSPRSSRGPIPQCPVLTASSPAPLGFL
jgi:hypothetical protein